MVSLLFLKSLNRLIASSQPPEDSSRPRNHHIPTSLGDLHPVHFPPPRPGIYSSLTILQTLHFRFLVLSPNFCLETLSKPGSISKFPIRCSFEGSTPAPHTNSYHKHYGYCCRRDDSQTAHSRSWMKFLPRQQGSNTYYMYRTYSPDHLGRNRPR